MKQTLTKDDGTSEDYEFIPRKLMSPEAEAIEECGGMAWNTFEQFGIAFMAGSQRAYRAALWVCMKRKQPGIKFHDVSFRIDQLLVDYSDAEKEAIRAAIAIDPELDPAQRENLLDIIDTANLADAEHALTVENISREPGLSEPGTNSEDDDSTSQQQG
jgi:hypothetical protein